MHPRLVPVVHHLSKPAIALGGAAVIALVAVGFALHSSSVAPTGQYATATMAPITAVGGATSDLSFQISGQVVGILTSIGQKVEAGTTLITLDQTGLAAARAGAVANLEAVQAKLASLQAGTRPEQLAINQTAVTQTKNALASALQLAYANADDAVHARSDQLFTNPRSATAQLTIIVPDATLVNRLQEERIALENTFTAWSAAVAAGADHPDTVVGASEANMRSVAAFLSDLTVALAETQTSATLTSATLVGYQSSINTARLNVLSSLSGLISADTSYKAAVGALTLAQAGATANDIAAQKAVVDAAEATLRGIDVTLRQTTLMAPVSGTVTALNAHLGQTATPGQIIASITSIGGSKESALVVPTSSVIKDGAQAFVYVKNGDAPIKTLVTIGLQSTSATEITSGISAGQEVLTFGVTQ